MRRILALAAGLFLSLAPVTGLAAPMAAGIVADLEGPAKAVQVIHGQDSFSPQVGFLLYAGDRVAVASPGARVHVSLFDGRPPLAIDKDNAGVQGVITAGNPPPTVMDNLLRWLVRRLPRQEGTTPCITRGDSRLVLASTEGGEPQLIAAGKRDWIVAWRGGQGPYAVRLVRQEAGKDAVVAQRADLRESQTIFTAVDVLPGRYRLEVTCAGKKAGVDLMVVPPSQRPGMPGEIADLGYPEGFKGLLYIAWLHSRPAWRFEALQQAARASRNDPEAAKVLRAMEAGTGDYLD